MNWDFLQKIHEWIISNMEIMLYIGKWIFSIIFICSSVVLIFLVLLQRGEEGAFSKNRGDKITADNNTLIRATILCSAVLFGSSMILTGIICKDKHLLSKHNIHNVQAINNEIDKITAKV